MTVFLSFSRLLCGISHHSFVCSAFCTATKVFRIFAKCKFDTTYYKFQQQIYKLKSRNLLKRQEERLPLILPLRFLRSETIMAKLAKPVVGRKSLENVNEEAVVSSSSGFLSGEDDAVTSTKGKGRGRKAKKELAIEVDAMPIQKVVKSAKASGTGRGRKKLSNEEEKTQATPAENAIVDKKSSSTKARGKKSAELATVEGQLLAEVNTNEENGVVKAPPKRGRKPAATKVEDSATNNDSGPVITAAPATKGRGRGNKDAVVAVEEPEATQSKLEEPIKQKKPKKSAKDIPIDEGKQNGESSEMALKDVKKKATKRSKAKGEQIESNEASETVVEPKKSKTKRKTPQQEPREEQNGELLEKPVEKPVKASAANKRKANKKAPELENSVEASEVVLKVEPEEEDAKPSPKKMSKKEPKEKKPKETKPRARTTKLEEQEQLENGILEKEKRQPRKRGAAKNIAPENTDETDGAKPAKSKKTAGALVNTTVTKYNKEDFQLQSSEDGAEKFNLKISSWNVAGLRSWLNKDGLTFLDYELPDIFCLQEIKCTIDQLPEQVARIPGYHPYWLCMPGGYAGVAIYSKIMPINVEYGIGNKEFDSAGRMITAEYEKFFLINVYVPNSGRKLVNLEARMRWEKLFQEYVKRLDAIKPVVICGDMNVSHQAIDLANPKTNTLSAGFTQEERDKMTELLALGFVDTFRHLYPDRTAAYTYWTYMGKARSRNVGWRLDYFIVSERFTKRVLENCIRSQVMGSDHCPITLFLKM
ncbi:recombination repair protein 1-like [Anastrepha ludens]|uniref:recombination repair protein 1-like n=1 Tax=Anastrepha ludens TaxID=28586 RepID=UPI0023AEE947|nr:recombination repair protein 1-like [Anastrepha ludens]